MFRKCISVAFFLLVAFAVLEGKAKEQIAGRNPKWAVPIEKPGCPNLFKVSGDLYRGAQPEAKGFRELKKMGIKTVINLRKLHSDIDLIGDTGLAYEAIPMWTWHPEDEDVVRFLKIVTNKDRIPVFVHCQHGADRTGTMCAIYRMAMQGWTKDEAIEEMTKGGFSYHDIWDASLLSYLRDLNIEALKQRAGIN